jgi:ubiquinone/menaquinone biosynthesis C-methylase UbiE
MHISDYEKLNLKQGNSEIDSFTLERYVQFCKHYTQSNNPSILDIGCNTGRGGKILRDRFPKARIHGLDVVVKRVEDISEGIYDDVFYTSAANIPLAADCLDFIVAGEVIEHIASEDIPVVLNECYRVLQKDGLLMLTTPNPHSIKVVLGNRAIFDESSHISIMPPKALAEKLKSARFKKISIYGSGKATRYLPENFPLLTPFGSYLIIGKK